MIVFNLFEKVSKLPEIYVAAQVAQSTAWRIDTMIVSEARKIFKMVRESVNNGVDSLNELTAAFSEYEFAQQSFEDAGLKGESLEVIRALASQREQWHELASELTALTTDYSGNPKVYNIPDLETEFHKEPKLKVSNDTQRKLLKASTRLAEAYGQPEIAKEAYERRLQRKQDNLSDIRDKMMEQAPAAFFMYQMALRSDDSSQALRSKEFTALPISVQATLLNNAISAAERAVEWAADDRSITESEFDRIDMCHLSFVKQIRTTLQSEQFKANALEPANI